MASVFLALLLYSGITFCDFPSLFKCIHVVHRYFGAAGSVEVSALLTKVFKSIQHVPLVGFSGLMLAVTEDLGLAEGTQKHYFDIFVIVCVF